MWYNGWMGMRVSRNFVFEIRAAALAKYWKFLKLVLDIILILGEIERGCISKIRQIPEIDAWHNSYPKAPQPLNILFSFAHWNPNMNVVIGFTQLIGTAISIKSSKELIYPSITICTHKSEAHAMNYTPTLNETLLAVIYHAPNGSQHAVSPSVPDVENRDLNLSVQRFIILE